MTRLQESIEQTLQAIECWFDKNSIGPSVREISEITGFSISTTALALDALEKSKHIQTERFRNGRRISRRILLIEALNDDMENPRVVCLCGSTRFSQAYQEANLRETLEGRIVLTIGVDMKSNAELFADKSPGELAEIKHKLDALHKRKIDLADEILVLNVGGYIGASTQSEIDYASLRNKVIRYLE